MSDYVDMVFSYQRCNGKVADRGKDKVMVINSRGKALWKVSSPTLLQSSTFTKQVVSSDRLKKWLSYLLDNLYVTAGGALKVQRVGMPMGTSCSPILVNLLLFMFEFMAVKKVIANPPNSRRVHVFDIKFKDLTEQQRKERIVIQEKLLQLSCCVRYMDDLFNPLMPEVKFRNFLAGAYPKWLEVGDPEQRGKIVDFLDMSIWYDHGTRRWESKLYDKRVGLQKMGLQLNKFPHPDSKLSRSCKYGVITSQLNRFMHCCSKPGHFLEAACGLYGSYLSKGYERPIIDEYCDQFIRRSWHKHNLRLRQGCIGKDFARRYESGPAVPWSRHHASR